MERKFNFCPRCLGRGNICRLVKINLWVTDGCTYIAQSLIPAVQAEIKPTEALLGTVP
jgi:hypothetical protein